MPIGPAGLETLTMTLHFTFDPLSALSLPIALVGEEGSFTVRLNCSPEALQKRLRTIRAWLLDWQMPHRLDIGRTASALQIAVSFPEAAHAHAFQIQFGGCIVAAAPGQATAPSRPELRPAPVIGLSAEPPRRRLRGGQGAHHGDRSHGADRIGSRRQAAD